MHASGMNLLRSALMAVVLAACGDDSGCPPHELRCEGPRAQACRDDGQWETILTCPEDRSCSLAINTCLAEYGQSPCCREQLPAEP